MDYKKSYILLQLGWICGISITFFGLWLSMKIEVMGNILAFFGFIAMLSGIGQGFLFFRCPKFPYGKKAKSLSRLRYTIRSELT